MQQRILKLSLVTKGSTEKGITIFDAAEVNAQQKRF
jgi:hypothetical protein